MRESATNRAPRCTLAHARNDARGGDTHTTREELPLLPKSKQNKGGSARRRAPEACAAGAGAGWQARRERAQRPRRADKRRRLPGPAPRPLRLDSSGVSAQAGGLHHSRPGPALTSRAPGPSRVTSELRRPGARDPHGLSALPPPPTADSDTAVLQAGHRALPPRPPARGLARASPRRPRPPARSLDVGPGRARGRERALGDDGRRGADRSLLSGALGSSTVADPESFMFGVPASRKPWKTALD